ncbi:lipase 1-like [Danaus plexippus]|uniref:lipase 1-like n=1 Tax=Danaus plexippus TaxID=13037 RepID=UPI002AB2F086|nr:lipase 1-like [Danaus plexippus]
MASKARVTFNVLLAALIIENILRFPLVTLINNSFNSTACRSPEFYGINLQEHNVTTEDGYILKIFRVSGRNCVVKKRPPVILMHGLLQSSDVWFDAGPGAGLAYLISDACYDLWLGNQRGNYHAKRHLILDPDRNPHFWHFSVDEIGFYDIPATIDYVLKATGEEKLNYVGYSQGAGTFFIMCSERPGYCDKANVLIGVAPAARQTHTKSLPYRALTKSVEKLEGTLTNMGINELFARGSFGQQFSSFFCNLNSITAAVCGGYIGVIDSFHPGSIDVKTLRHLFTHFPDGTSTHNIARYGQSMSTRFFQKFDYGESKNLKIYGDIKPPKFNLSAVTVPFVNLYGRNDKLVDPKDISWLLKQLPNVLEDVEVSDPSWNHIDVAYSQLSKKLIYPKIDEYLSKYSDVM